MLNRFLRRSGALVLSRKNYGSHQRSMSKFAMVTLHHACRNRAYVLPSGKQIQRFQVPDDKVPWDVDWPEYLPPVFTAEGVSNKPWADPDIGPHFKPHWNDCVNGMYRVSHMGPYKIENGHPLNPVGRTGLRGRGRLGRWGPNHAVDAIVTRWKRESDVGDTILHPISKLPVLQFVAIKRHDTGDWAIPGGFVDFCESFDDAVKREFLEEALNIQDSAAFFATKDGEIIRDFLRNNLVIYEGYVDDPRNTDNAWIETRAYQYHDDTGSTVALMDITAGDDAADAQWTDVSGDLQLYASHSGILRVTAHRMDAHW